MKKSERRKQLEPESMFDRWARIERSKKLNRHDIVFFGLSVLLTIQATQNVLFIQ